MTIQSLFPSLQQYTHSIVTIIRSGKVLQFYAFYVYEVFLDTIDNK